LFRLDWATEDEIAAGLSECAVLCGALEDVAAQCPEHGRVDARATHQALLRECEEHTRFLLAGVRASRNRDDVEAPAGRNEPWVLRDPADAAGSLESPGESAD
jgi:hypothetical protein